MPLANPDDAEIHILHVDDDEDDLVVVRNRLKTLSVKLSLDTAVHGEEARDYILGAANDETRRVPDIVLLDLNMPVMSGQEFLKWLRSSPEFSHMQVIVLTTSSDPEVLREAMEMGANATLTKDFDAEDKMRLGQMIVDLWFHGQINPLQDFTR